MVKNQYNKGSYAEMFDIERLREIAELAKKDKVPNSAFSDLECNVWLLMRELVEYGQEA